jgi:hypothetical protein
MRLSETRVVLFQQTLGNQNLNSGTGFIEICVISKFFFIDANKNQCIKISQNLQFYTRYGFKFTESEI